VCPVAQALRVFFSLGFFVDFFPFAVVVLNAAVAELNG
jgi:hypothetical protein